MKEWEKAKKDTEKDEEGIEKDIQFKEKRENGEKFRTKRIETQRERDTEKYRKRARRKKRGG